MSRRSLRAVGALAALALMVTGCAADENKDNDNKDTQRPGAISIGADIELSGPAGVQGYAYASALRLTADRINKRGLRIGGKKVLVGVALRDNKSDPTESVQVAKSIIADKKSVAIIGGGSTPTTMSIVDTVEAGRIPTISMGSSGAIVNPIDKRRYMFKTPANTDAIIQVMLDAFDKQGVRKIGFLSVDNAYGDAGLAGMTAAAKAGKVQLVGKERFGPTDKDFTVQVTKLAAKKPDAIVVWAVPPGAGIAAQNIKQAHFGGKVFFDAGAGAELFLKGAGADAEGMYMVHPQVLAGDQLTGADPRSAAAKAFYTDFRGVFKSFSGFASYAADALNLIVAAMQKADSLDRDKIRDALETLQFTGATGSYSFGPDNHGGVRPDSLKLLVVKGGKWTLADN